MSDPFEIIPGLIMNPWGKKDGLYLNIMNNSFFGSADALSEYRAACRLNSLSVRVAILELPESPILQFLDPMPRFQSAQLQCLLL